MSEEELPDGWASLTLDDVAEWGSGGTPSRTRLEYYGGSIPWIKTGELGQRLITDTEEKISELGLQNSSAKLFPSGAVALAMYGATIGKVSILGVTASTNQACAVGVPKEGVTTSEYLYYYLASQKEEFIKVGKGGAQPNISQGLVKSWTIPLAPINEQKRIADKLDNLLARVDACRERLERVPGILKRFRQAVLTAAASGKLTTDCTVEVGLEDNRGLGADSNLIAPSDIPFHSCKNWAIMKIGDIVSLIDGDRGPNYPKQDDYMGEGDCLFLSTKNVRPYGFDFRQTTFISLEKHQTLRNGTLKVGDVVITTRGTLGNVAVYKADIIYKLVRINSGMLILRPKDSSVAADFLKVYIASSMFTDQLAQMKSGSAQPQIPAGTLKHFKIAVPPVVEQNEIIRRVEKLFVYADQLETRYRAARAAVERLTPALLAKAFRGELVPQDPNDEPASVLLERIAASRGEATTASKPKRATTPRAKKTTPEADLERLEATVNTMDDFFDGKLHFD